MLGLGLGLSYRTGSLRPALDLNFLGGALDSRFTLTRASAGWAFNSAGVLTSYATNVPRFDYDPATLAPRGLLLEEARTNLFLNSAVGVTQAVTVAAVANTLSFYGTGTITLTGTSTAGPLVGTGVNNRVSLTFTPTAGALTLTVSGSCTNVQLEAGAFATSPIVTVGATVTRALDLCSALTSAFVFNAAEGTLFAAYTPAGVTGHQVAIYMDDGTANERMGVRVASAALAGIVVDGGVTQASVSGGTQAAAATKAAMAYKLNDIALSVNGGAVATDTLATLPTVTKLLIGARLAGSESMSGWYARAAYYNSRLSDATLIRITT
jgi:hypothetical protein